MSYKIIWEYLYNEINDIPKLNTRTWNYEKTGIDTFPNAIIYPEPTWSRQIIKDTNNYTINTIYVVRITDANKDRQVMEDRMRELVDQALDKIRKINQSCEMYNITTDIRWGYDNSEQPKRVAELIVSATTITK